MNLRTFFLGRAIGFIVVLIILGLFFAYKSTLRDVEPIQQASETKGELLEGGEADPSRMKLDMKSWVWVSSLYNDGRTVQPKKAGIFTLSLSPDGTFTATTDCNSAHGTYTASTNTIAFGPIAMTRMYCGGSQEMDFIRSLETASGYHFTSRGQLILDLKFDSGSVTFQ
jgi:heat shock protein HslJ